ncbi:hypothetical protein JAAARDRAFT_31264 [Jaapia argillacea MUCL 33604]|uniref:C2H2-type domain-containing protein n=1 Tax=Jaapia argillacea MUCL 33604 TaxID=933084 RepID=A0A067Q3Z7_9AGAM|nr:hypothetical protein JAAARDRAFT_31264 [Jaapia argillacea MUCL 33604]
MEACALSPSSEGWQDCMCMGRSTKICEECKIPEFTAQITPQCTDQCVVVPCTDCVVSDPPCVATAGPYVCNFSCQGGYECSGFQEFLQCCSNGLQTYPGSSGSSTSGVVQPPFPLDLNFNPLLCDCMPPNQGLQHGAPPAQNNTHFHTPSSLSDAGCSIVTTPSLQPSPPSQFTHLGSSNQFRPLESDSQSFAGPSQTFTIPPTSPTPPVQSFANHHPSHALSLQTHAQLPPPTPSPTSSASSFPCMWADCHSTFTSLTELVGHVNVQHLRLPSPAPSPHRSSMDNLSCHWGDCQLYPNPASSADAPTDNQLDTALSILATHLFQDHLGLPPNPFLARLNQAQAQLNSSPFTHPTPSATPTPTLSSAPSPGGSSATSSPRLSGALSESLTLSSFTSTSTPFSPSTSFSPASTFSPTSTPAPTPTSAPTTPRPSLHECSDDQHYCRWQNCRAVFATCDELTEHTTSAHVGGGKSHYDCFWEGCARNGANGFASKQKICRHLQSHTGHRPFQCKVCKQYFSEAATLQQHMRRHTQEKPYVCDFPGCGKAFAITGALTIHKRIHNGQKPFKCTYCEKAFAESSNLSKHLRTHTGARPYTCTEKDCNKSFARPDQLTRHMGVHKKKGGVKSS